MVNIPLFRKSGHESQHVVEANQRNKGVKMICGLLLDGQGNSSVIIWSVIHEESELLTGFFEPGGSGRLPRALAGTSIPQAMSLTGVIKWLFLSHTFKHT
jgi:hypothetical protein